VLFSLKKITKIWGLYPQTDFPRRLGTLPPDQHLSQDTFWILLSASVHKRTDSFGINQKILFSCNYCGSAPDFRRRKNYAAFRMSKITEIITIGFDVFHFVYLTHFALAPPLICGRLNKIKITNYLRLKKRGRIHFELEFGPKILSIFGPNLA